MSDHSRRTVLKGLGGTGVAGLVSLAGCSRQGSGGGGDSTDAATETEMEDGDMDTQTSTEMSSGGEAVTMATRTSLTFRFPASRSASEIGPTTATPPTLSR